MLVFVDRSVELQEILQSRRKHIVNNALYVFNELAELGPQDMEHYMGIASTGKELDQIPFSRLDIATIQILDVFSEILEKAFAAVLISE
jgi:hypothetical protein